MEGDRQRIIFVKTGWEVKERREEEAKEEGEK